MTRHTFEEIVWNYYRAHGRHDLPWRRTDSDGSFDPYKIMVSEIMLQQTQVARVITKYQEFLARFPTVAALAAAPLADVLQAWSGLGYNRRAKFLWQAAQQIHVQHGGEFPKDVTTLTTLPGIGKNTAGALVAYTFDRPVVYVETNIRTVYIHHFFADQAGISDAALLLHIERSLDELTAAGRSAREWYWALMDYGTHLKQTVGNLSRHSKTYAKQSTFVGSKRQVRGKVLRELSTGNKELSELDSAIQDDRLCDVLFDLQQEGMIFERNGHYHLGSA